MPPVEETAALFERVSEGTLAPPAVAAPRQRRPVPGPPPELPLVGRDAELEPLLAAHRAAARDGAPGRDRRRGGHRQDAASCVELAGQRPRGGATVLAARCHEDEAGLPYGPIVELLRRRRSNRRRLGGRRLAAGLADASQLLPELGSVASGAAAPLPLDAPGARVRLLEGVAAVLGAAGQGSGARSALRGRRARSRRGDGRRSAYLGRSLDARPLLLVVSWRSEAVPPGPSSSPASRRPRREAARRRIVRLDRLDEAERGARSSRGRPGRPRPELERPSLSSRARACRYSSPSTCSQWRPADDTAPDWRFPRGAHPPGRPPGRPRRDGAPGARSGGGDRPLVRPRHRARGERTQRRGGGGGAGASWSSRAGARAAPVPSRSTTSPTTSCASWSTSETTLARRRLLHRRIAARYRAAGGTRAPRSSRSNCDWPATTRRPPSSTARRRTRRVAARPRRRPRAPRGGAGARAIPTPRRCTSGSATSARSSATTAGRSPATRGGRVRRGRRARAAIEQKLGGVHQRRGEWERAEARFAPRSKRPARTTRGLRARILADLALTLHQRASPGARRAREQARPGRGRGRRPRAGAGPQHARRARPRTTASRAGARASSSAASRWPSELARIRRARRGAQQPRAGRRDAGELEARARADEARARALRRPGRPPPRGRAREQPRRPPSRGGARRGGDGPPQARGGDLLGGGR